MKQEFTISRGKIIVDHDRLLIRNTEKKIVSSFPFQLLMIFAIVGVFIERVIENSWRPGTFLLGAFSILGLIVLYDLIRNSHVSNTIPLNRISSFAVKSGASELETHVILYMRSGRYKIIPFRTLERQHEEFTTWLSLHTGVINKI